MMIALMMMLTIMMTMVILCDPYDDWAIAYGYSTCPHSEAKLPAVYEDNKIFVQNGHKNFA